MGSFVSDFSEGYKRGEARRLAKEAADYEIHSDKKKAELAQFNKDRDFGLKVGTESRLLAGAGEDEWQRLEEFINVSGDKWDPALAYRALAKAKAIDETYGAVLPRSAHDYFARALNIKAPAPSQEGKQGPPSPDSMKASPLAGFSSQSQKDAYTKRKQSEETERQLGEIQDMAFEFVKETATDADGILRPEMAGLALLEFQTELEKKGVDKSLTTPMFLNLSKQMKEAMSALGGTAETPEETQKRRDKTSVTMDAWINRNYSYLNDDGMLMPIDGSAPGKNMVSAAANHLVNLDIGVPTIKQWLIEAYVTEDGNWPHGAKASPHEVALKQLGKDHPEAKAQIEAMFRSGVDPLTTEVVYDPESRMGGLLDRTTGQWVTGQPLVGPNSPVTYGDTPAPADGPEKKRDSVSEVPEKKTQVETAFLNPDGTLKMSAGDAEEQVMAFLGGLKDIDQRTRRVGKYAGPGGPGTYATKQDLLAKAKDIRSGK